MELKFLGAGSAFNPSMGNSNAYFTLGKSFCLLDCGETAFNQIWNMFSYVSSEEVVVFITHLHSDHVGSLGSLISYSYYILRKKITVVHPLDTIVQLLDLLGIARECYIFLKIEPGIKTEFLSGLGVKPLQVDHVPNMICFSYVLFDEKETVYFSGDSLSPPLEVVSGIKDGSIERAYQDTSNTQSDHTTHALLSSLEKIFPFESRHRVYCMHLDYDYSALLRQKGFMVVKLDD